MIRLFNRSTAAHKVRARAVEYASHGWPVAPLAVPQLGRCPCEKGDCHSPHLAGPATVDPVEAEEIWSTNWNIALVTSEFDIVELPAKYGAALHHKLLTTCPTAMAYRHRRWFFVMVAGSLDPDDIEAAEGKLHSGPDNWIPGPPFWSEDTGRVDWLVQPYLTHWKPYLRLDLVDLVFRRIRPRPLGRATAIDHIVEETR